MLEHAAVDAMEQGLGVHDPVQLGVHRERVVGRSFEAGATVRERHQAELTALGEREAVDELRTATDTRTETEEETEERWHWPQGTRYPGDTGQALRRVRRSGTPSFGRSVTVGTSASGRSSVVETAKRRAMVTRTSTASIIANALPMHTRGPPPNGK